MKKVSIIVPVYNTSKYLNKCIDSLLNQTYKDLEIIVINDGSTDDSEKIIKFYNDKRIKLISKNNEGIGKTRNIGIENSTGDYIMFIDSDDYVRSDCVEKFVSKCEMFNCDLVVSNYYKDEDSITEVRLPSFENTTLKESPQVLNQINLGPCNKIYKRTLLINNNIKFEEKLKYEDAPFMIKVLCNSAKIGKIDDCLSYYVIHDNSETTRRDEKIFDIIEICHIIKSELDKYDYLDEEKINLLAMILTDYAIQTRYIKSSRVRNDFIDDAFKFLLDTDFNWKKCTYLKKFSKIKRLVKTSKMLTKLYCYLYSKGVKR